MLVPLMASTYTQIYIHVVFAVEGRQNLIRQEHNDDLQKFITGIVSNQKQKLIAINNMPDHNGVLFSRLARKFAPPRLLYQHKIAM